MDDSAEEFGPYLVYEQLGIGGVATVHRAEVRGVAGFRKLVALKRLLPHLVTTEPIVQAFVREARLASHMQHENIAQTYELGKVGQTYFIAMEYVPGPTLDQIIRHSQAVAGAIPIPVALGILIQLCDALDYAHNLCDDTGKPLGIIHRDVSPPNLIVSNTGTVKLLDFGIAKVMNDDHTNVTGKNIIKGRFSYIAPEYLEGSLDWRADLFAIGVIAHELLTGRRLFDGPTDFDTSAMVLTMPIQPPSRWAARVPRDLDDIVLTALQRDPALRWQSAAALRHALANAARAAEAATDHAKVLEWVHWAFSQKSRPSNQKLANVIDMLDQPSSVERVLTPEQKRALDEFKTPIPTMPGVGDASELMKSQERQKLLRQLESGGTARIGSAKHLVVNARPLPHVRTRQLAAGSLVPADHEETGPSPIVRPSAPSGRGGLRMVLYVVLVLVAAGGGVLAAAHLLDIDLL